MSKNNSPLKFIGGMMGSISSSFSGAASMAQRVQNARNAPGGLSANMNNASAYNSSFENAVSSLYGGNQASATTPPPHNPGAVRDPNNISSAISESIISQADMNRTQDRNSGTGQITQSMHEMNSDMPMVRPMASKPRMQPGMGYSSAVSPFSQPELNTGNSLYGGEQQKQEIMNPMPIANIDTTGMNSLYS